jgi:hypothetical protein
MVDEDDNEWCVDTGLEKVVALYISVSQSSFWVTEKTRGKNRVRIAGNVFEIWTGSLPNTIVDGYRCTDLLHNSVLCSVKKGHSNWNRAWGFSSLRRISSKLIFLHALRPSLLSTSCPSLERNAEPVYIMYYVHFINAQVQVMWVSLSALLR